MAGLTLGYFLPATPLMTLEKNEHVYPLAGNAGSGRGVDHHGATYQPGGYVDGIHFSVFGNRPMSPVWMGDPYMPASWGTRLGITDKHDLCDTVVICCVEDMLDVYSNWAILGAKMAFPVDPTSGGDYDTGIQVEWCNTEKGTPGTISHRDPNKLYLVFTIYGSGVAGYYCPIDPAYDASVDGGYGGAASNRLVFELGDITDLQKAEKFWCAIRFVGDTIDAGGCLIEVINNVTPDFSVTIPINPDVGLPDDWRMFVPSHRIANVSFRATAIILYDSDSADLATWKTDAAAQGAQWLLDQRMLIDKFRPYAPLIEEEYEITSDYWGVPGIVEQIGYTGAVDGALPLDIYKGNDLDWRFIYDYYTDTYDGVIIAFHETNPNNHFVKPLWVEMYSVTYNGNELLLEDGLREFVISGADKVIKYKLDANTPAVFSYPWVAPETRTVKLNSFPAEHRKDRLQFNILPTNWIGIITGYGPNNIGSELIAADRTASVTIPGTSAIAALEWWGTVNILRLRVAGSFPTAENAFVALVVNGCVFEVGNYGAGEGFDEQSGFTRWNWELNEDIFASAIADGRKVFCEILLKRSYHIPSVTRFDIFNVGTDSASFEVETDNRDNLPDDYDGDIGYIFFGIRSDRAWGDQDKADIYGLEGAGFIRGVLGTYPDEDGVNSGVVACNLNIYIDGAPSAYTYVGYLEPNTLYYGMAFQRIKNMPIDDHNIANLSFATDSEGGFASVSGVNVGLTTSANSGIDLTTSIESVVI